MQCPNLFLKRIQLLLADVNRLFARAFDEALKKAGFALTSGEARALAYIPSMTVDGRRHLQG